MENLKVETKRIILDPRRSFTFDIRDAIDNLGINKDEKKEKKYDKDAFYHIYVEGDVISVEKQWYNTPAVEVVEFDMSKLEDSQKFDAIRTTYSATFSFVGDLVSRVTTMQKDWNADMARGASHAFYHDRTGMWKEHEIAEEIARINSELFKGRGR